MSDSVGRIELDLGVNQSQFNREIKTVANRAGASSMGGMQKLGATLGKAFAVAFVAQKLFDFGKAGVELASNLHEVQNVVDVTFGGMSEDINKWSKTTLTQFGMSELSAKKFSSTMGAMLKSSGITGNKLKEMSTGLASLAGDMASFYNLDLNDAFYKLQAGISGEIEPLRRLGINLTQANVEAWLLTKGIKVNMQQLDFATQSLYRYNYIMEVTKDAQGDFVRTQDGWANQTRLLNEQWKIFQGTIGAGFMAALTPVVKGLNVLIKKLQIAAEYFKQFAEMIFGQAQTSKGAVLDVSDSMGSLGDSTDDVGKATKKTGKSVKGALAGFDQLNTLSQNAAANMGDLAADSLDIGGIGELGDANLGVNIDSSSMDKFRSALDGLKSDVSGMVGLFQSKFGPALRSVFDGLMPVLSNWKSTFVDVFKDVSSLLEPLRNWFVNSLVPAIAKVIPIMGGMFNGVLDSAQKVFQGIWDAAFPVIGWFVESGLPMLTEFSVGVWEIFGSMFDYVKTVFDTLWEGAVQPGLSLVSKMVVDVLDIIKGFWDKWGREIVDGIKGAFENIKMLFQKLWDKFLGPIVTNMLDGLTQLWDNHLKGLVEEVANFIGKLVTGATDLYNKFIAPIVGFLIDEFGPAFSNTFSLIGDLVMSVVGVVADVAGAIFRVLGGITDFVIGVFTGDWEKAWRGVSDIFIGIFNGISGTFKGVINVLIDGLNYFIRGMNNMKFGFPDWVPMVGGKSFGVHINEIPKLASGGIVSQPTLAMIGEGNKKEAVVPLENSAFVAGFANTIAQAVASALAGSSGGGGGGDSPETIVLKIGETEFGRIAVRSIKKLQRQTGVAMLTV